MTAIVGIVAMGISLLLSSCAEGQQHHEEQQEEIIVSALPATEQASEASGEALEVESLDPFARYEANNSRLDDREEPFNQGVEPLCDFLLSYREDPSLVRRRIQLPPGISAPSYVGDPFAIIPPDSTGYFASWITLEQDTVSFCSGYLDSDILEQYTFGRLSPDERWHLIDYYNAATQSNISEYAN